MGIKGITKRARGKPMRLSYLREFIALCQELNYNRAAANLHISQSALTKHIQALESDLNTELFERDRRHVTLTSQGEVMLEHAQRICREYDEVKQMFAAEAANSRRLLVGGLVDSPGEFAWMSRATNALLETFPDFSPHFVPVASVSPTTQLLNREIDLALFAFRPDDYDEKARGQLESVPVTTCPFVAVVPAASSLARKSELCADDLQGRTFVHMMGPRMTSGWKQVQRVLDANGIRHETRQISIGSAYDYVGVNLGEGEVLLMLECELRRDQMNGASKRNVRLDLKDANVPISAVYRTGERTEVMDAFIKQLEKTPL